MSQPLTRISRIAVYVVFVATAIASGIWISHRYVVSRHVRALEKRAGTTFPKDLNWQKGRNTIVLVLQQDCRFCFESVRFYQRLVSRATQAQVRVVVLMPDDPGAARRYISEAGVEVREVFKLNFILLGFGVRQPFTWSMARESFGRSGAVN